MGEMISVEAWQKGQAAKRKLLGTSQATVMPAPHKLRRAKDAHALWEHQRHLSSRRRKFKSHVWTVLIAAVVIVLLQLSTLSENSKNALSGVTGFLAVCWLIRRQFRTEKQMPRRSDKMGMKWLILFGYLGVPILYVVISFAGVFLWPKQAGDVAGYGIAVVLFCLVMTWLLQEAVFGNHRSGAVRPYDHRDRMNDWWKRIRKERKIRSDKSAGLRY